MILKSYLSMCRMQVMGAAIVAIGLSSTSQAAKVICWDGGSGREWAAFKGSCEDFGGGQSTNAKCYDIEALAAGLGDTGVLVNGVHAGLDQHNASLGQHENGVQVISAFRSDDEFELRAIKEVTPDGLFLANLPLVPPPAQGSGQMVGTVGRGFRVPLPPLVPGVPPQYLSDEPVQADFAIYWYDIDLTTNEIVQSEVIPIYDGELAYRFIRPSDLNLDGGVDGADAGILFANWGQAGMGDLTADGLIDAADAGMMFQQWTGDSQSTAYVPEPGVSAVSALLCLMGLSYRQLRPVSAN